MPTLEAIPNVQPTTKLLLIGDSGTGKTGSLVSLVREGYRLRVLDFDNKIAGGILPQLVRRDCPDKLKDIEFEPLRDNFKASGLGPIIDGAPRAFIRGLELLDKWTDGSKPGTWGKGHVLVLDSLTFFSDAAYNWAKGMNPSAKDPRQWFYTAQQAIENTLALLTSSTFSTDVIVIAHVDYQSRPDGTMKGYPTSVGKALGPTIPAYFENMALCTVNGGKRFIQTTPTALIDLKNPAAFKMVATMPQESGLAEFFKTVKA